MAELLGYSSDEMIGMDLFEIAQRGFESEGDEMLSLDRSRIPGPKEVPFRRKDGNVVWALLLLSPIFDRQGHYAGALATVGDLTQQKQREDVLRDRVAQLEAALRSSAATPHARRPASMAVVPRGNPTAELIRGAIALGTFATFVTTVALLTGWGVVSGLLQKGEKRERPADWDFDP